MKFAVFFAKAVCHFARNERRRSKDELERLDLLQLGLQSFERINGEARRRDPELRSCGDCLLQTVAE